MAAFWFRALNPLGPVGAQAAAQACNLILQLSLLALLGPSVFADVGLGLATANLVCFIGESGFTPYFLRETARNPGWMDAWRAAVAWRVAVLIGAAAAAWPVLGWGAPNPQTALSVLVAAVPGIVVSAALPAPLLFGLGQVRWASAGILARFSVQCSIAAAVCMLRPDLASIAVGSAFSIGVVVQVALGQWAGLSATALLPRFRLRLPPPEVLRMWGLSAAGSVSDRVLPFIIGAVRPDMLAIALIVLQVLHGLIGLAAQLDRLLIPAVAQGGDLRSIWGRGPWILGAGIGIVGCVLTATAWRFYPGQHWAALLLALEWGCVVTGAVLFSLAFAGNNEKAAATLILWIAPLSAAGQIALGRYASLEAALLLRVAVTASVAWLSWRCWRTAAGGGHV